MAIHLNEAGDRVLREHRPVTSHLYPGIASRHGENAALNWSRCAKPSSTKIFYWFNRYRVTDGYSAPTATGRILKFAEGPGGYGEGLSNYDRAANGNSMSLDVLTSQSRSAGHLGRSANGKDYQVNRTTKTCPEFIPGRSPTSPARCEGGKHMSF